jgi:hypothetical protein
LEVLERIEFDFDDNGEVIAVFHERRQRPARL